MYLGCHEKITEIEGCLKPTKSRKLWSYLSANVCVSHTFLLYHDNQHNTFLVLTSVLEATKENSRERLSLMPSKFISEGLAIGSALKT